MPTIRNGLVHTDKAIKAIRTLITNSAEYHDLKPNLQEFINAQLFGNASFSEWAPSSVLLARRSAAEAMKTVTQHFFPDRSTQSSEPYFATFAYHAGEVPMSHKLRNAQTMINAAKAALLAHEMDGILTPDIDLLLPRGAREPIIAFHLHGIVVSTRASRRKLRLKKTGKELNSMIGLPSRLPCGSRLSGKRPEDFRQNVDNMATYAGKIVAAFKVETTKNGKQNFTRDRALLTPRYAFNQLYAWSQVPIRKSVLPVGPLGAEMRRAWLRQMKMEPCLNAPIFDFERDTAKELWREVLASVNSGAKGDRNLLSI